jgi:hypothetical protein
MATKTADAGHDFVQPRSNYNAITYMVSNYVANGSTVSAGDVFLMAKIPHGATIVDLKFFGRASAGGGTVFNLGTTTSASLFGPVTISATHQFIAVGQTAGTSATQQMPFLVSLSDDANPRHITLALTVATATSPTATSSFGLMVGYLMPGEAGP